MDVARIAADLAAEQQALDEVVGPLEAADWGRATPSPRWTIAHQIGHLAYFDHAAATAITDPEAFTAEVARLAEAAAGGDRAVDEFTLGDLVALPADALLDRWRAGRALLADAAATLDDETRVAWYGPSMGAKSFLTARLMETWAHAQDVVDALGAEQPATDRLRHIAQLGFITRGWSYANRGLDVPEEPVRLELAAPDGSTWTWGPRHAPERLTGPAVDFCLVVTQRRHPDDTALAATAVAREWLLIAQAFAGPATDGPAPGSRR